MQQTKCEFTDILQIVDKKIKSLESETLARFGLTHFHARYLSQLYRHDKMTMSELTENIGVDKANTTRAVRDLHFKGLLERASGGIRNFSLRLSNKGREVAVYLRDELTIFMKKLFSNFTDDEKNTLFSLLNKLLLEVRNVGNI